MKKWPDNVKDPETEAQELQQILAAMGDELRRVNAKSGKNGSHLRGVQGRVIEEKSEGVTASGMSLTPRACC